MSATAIAAPSEDPKEELRQLRRDFERLKDRLDEIERQEPPPYREESGNEMAHLLGPRHSTIPHIETPDSEGPAATRVTKTLARLVTGWMLYGANDAIEEDFEPDDLLVYLKASANTGGVPEVRYCKKSSGLDGADGDDGDDADPPSDQPFFWKGPFELYYVLRATRTVRVYGAAGLSAVFGANKDPWGYRGIWTNVAAGATGKALDEDIDVTTLNHIYLKVVLDPTTTPSFPAVVTLEQATAFPDVEDNKTHIVPLHYVPCTEIEGENVIDTENYERCISHKQLSQIS